MVEVEMKKPVEEQQPFVEVPAEGVKPDSKEMVLQMPLTTL